MVEEMLHQARGWREPCVRRTKAMLGSDDRRHIRPHWFRADAHITALLLAAVDCPPWDGDGCGRSRRPPMEEAHLSAGT